MEIANFEELETLISGGESGYVESTCLKIRVLSRDPGAVAL